VSTGEAIERFRCFGCDCGVLVIGDTPRAGARAGAQAARDRLLELHGRFSRFLADSELSRLNRDVRARVPVSPTMARLAEAVRDAGAATGGLVDATLLGELEQAGYASELGAALPLPLALALAPPRHAASPSRKAGWALLDVDREQSWIARPPGLSIDSGGLGKGLFADLLAEQLAAHESFAVDCGGDLAIGGSVARERRLDVQSPFDGTIIHSFHVSATGVATSGIGRRSWLGSDGRPAHHLLDPGSGRPAFTGVVQATALAPSALLAEVHAKAAVLSGPERAPAWLRWGGVLVFDDGSHAVRQPPGEVPQGSQLTAAAPMHRAAQAASASSSGASPASGPDWSDAASSRRDAEYPAPWRSASAATPIEHATSPAATQNAR
jgi:FAD:protein FMN transferase